MKCIQTSPLLLSLLIGFVSGCTTTGKDKSHDPWKSQSSSAIPIKPVSLVNPFPTTQLLSTSSNILHAYVQTLLQEKRIVQIPTLPTSPTDLDLFFYSQDIAIQLYEKRHYLSCQQFIAYLRQHIFLPFVIPTFELLDILAGFAEAPTPVSVLGTALNHRPIDIHRTPFKVTLFFMEKAFPILLASAEQNTLALRILDQFFEVYGYTEAYFQGIRDEKEKHHLNQLLATASAKEYQSEAMRGLIAASKIHTLHAQLQWNEAQKEAEQFLRLFPRHPMAVTISDLLATMKNVMSHTQHWRLAVLLPFSGPYMQMGKNILEGLAFALRTLYASAPSSTQEPKVSLFLLDTHKYKDNLPYALDRLIQKENISGIVGPLTLQTQKLILPVVQKHTIPTFTLAPIESAPDQIFLSETLPMIQLHPSLQHQLSYMLKILKEFQIPNDHAGILYPNSPFGKFHARTFQTILDTEHKTLSAADCFDSETPDAFKMLIAQFLGVFDKQDRKADIESYIQAYNTTTPSKPISETDVVLPPLTSFHILYMPTSIKDTSILIPMLKYFDANNFLILGPSTWQNEELIVRTGPYLKEAVIFDSFFVEDSSSPNKTLIETFQKEHGLVMNSDHYRGYLTGTIVQKALTLTPILSISTTAFLQEINQLEGVTPLGQRWKIIQGILALDPIPLVVVKKRFTRLTESWVKALRERWIAAGNVGQHLVK